MATTRYENDRGLTRRMIGTMFGLGLLYVVLAAVLIALGFYLLGATRALASPRSSSASASATESMR